jgi:hypothetical protein
MQSIVRHIILLFVLVSLYVCSHNGLLLQRAASLANQQRAASAWTLPAVVLKIISGEFKGIIADLIVLDAGAQLGTEIVRTRGGGLETVRKDYDWDTIHTLFINSQALDPRFKHTYMLAQGWLPWDAQMVDETQDILRTAAATLPWDWRPLHFIGFNAYYLLDRPGDAGKIFLEAAKIPHAPPFLAILGGRLAQKGGETEAAIMLMESVLVNMTEEDAGYQDIVERLQALLGVRVVELASGEFSRLFKRGPKTIDELIQSNLLKGKPYNPYGDDYCIDAKGGVHFDNLNCMQNE